MSSPADASVFQISDEELTQSEEYSQPDRINSKLIPEVEERTGFSIEEVELSSLNWQSALHSMERKFPVRDGWKVCKDRDTEEVFRWVPTTPVSSSPWEFLQYFTRRKRVKKDFKNLRGRYEEPNTVSLNYDLLENLADSTSHTVEEYIDATALEELVHLGLNQNLSLERSEGYSDPVRRREEQLADKLAEDIFQDINGYSREVLAGAESTYYEEALARLDKAVSQFGRELPPQLNPREAYRTDEEVPNEIYDFDTGLISEKAENWINEGEI